MGDLSQHLHFVVNGPVVLLLEAGQRSLLSCPSPRALGGITLHAADEWLIEVTCENNMQDQWKEAEARLHMPVTGVCK